jgi:hypothetical protein
LPIDRRPKPDVEDRPRTAPYNQRPTSGASLEKPVPLKPLPPDADGFGAGITRLSYVNLGGTGRPEYGGREIFKTLIST